MLTDKTIRAAGPKAKAYTLTDGNRLYLHVSTRGRRTWRFKFRFEKEVLLLVIGAYPCFFADRLTGNTQS